VADAEEAVSDCPSCDEWRTEANNLFNRLLEAEQRAAAFDALLDLAQWATLARDEASERNLCRLCDGEIDKHDKECRIAKMDAAHPNWRNW
jgi:hypothetical protein